VRPVIDSTHEQRDAAKAWKRLENADQFGKIALAW